MTISMAAAIKTTPNVACAARLLRRASRKASKAQCSAWLDWNDNCLILKSRSELERVYSLPSVSWDLMKSSFVLWVIMAFVCIFTSGSESESWYSCHSSIRLLNVAISWNSFKNWWAGCFNTKSGYQMRGRHGQHPRYSLDTRALKVRWVVRVWPSL